MKVSLNEGGALANMQYYISAGLILDFCEYLDTICVGIGDKQQDRTHGVEQFGKYIMTITTEPL